MPKRSEDTSVTKKFSLLLQPYYFHPTLYEGEPQNFYFQDSITWLSNNSLILSTKLAPSISPMQLCILSRVNN